MILFILLMFLLLFVPKVALFSFGLKGETVARVAIGIVLLLTFPWIIIPIIGFWLVMRSMVKVYVKVEK